MEAREVSKGDGVAEVEESRVVRLYSIWASGQHNEGFAYAAGRAKTQAGEIASDLFELHVMGTGSTEWVEATRRVKDWAYTEAADFVSSRRGPAKIRGYRTDWAHQAARDGLYIALWGHPRGNGLAARAEQFGVGERPYQRVRDHISDQAKKLLNRYEWELSAAFPLDEGC